MERKRVWLCSRVGHESQREILESHLQILKEYAHKEGFLIAGVTMETCPGKPDREGLDEILRAAKNGKMDYVLIIEYSRLFRGDLDSGLKFLDQLNAFDVKVLCLDENSRKWMEEIEKQRNTITGELKETESKWEAEEGIEDTENNGLMEEVMA